MKAADFQRRLKAEARERLLKACAERGLDVTIEPGPMGCPDKVTLHLLTKEVDSLAEFIQKGVK